MKKIFLKEWNNNEIPGKKRARKQWKKCVSDIFINDMDLTSTSLGSKEAVSCIIMHLRILSKVVCILECVKKVN